MEEIAFEEYERATVTFDQIAWTRAAIVVAQGVEALAPSIPEKALIDAMASYLDLANDEILLAIVGQEFKKIPRKSCALTSKRIYWPGEAPDAAATWADSPLEDTPVVLGPPRCQSLEYKDLPDEITITGFFSKVVNLGDDREIELGSSIRLQKALIVYLKEIRAFVRGEIPLPVLEPSTAVRWRDAWSEIVAADAHARELQRSLRSYHGKTLQTRKPVVTYVMAAISILVWIVMIVQGVSVANPTTDPMIAWGANYGPLVALDGELWRLLTSTFLHFGFLHLGLNMWCLLSAGPVLERFLGHLGFAALYLIAGLGGANASLVFHSMDVCAGASGAVFGVFGGLLGFLAIRHREVPAAILKPIRSGAFSFIGYNLFFGLKDPHIDMAAHVGGLATGFLVGLAFAGSWFHRRGGFGTIRRLATIAVLSILLGVVTHAAIGEARVKILKTPIYVAFAQWETYEKALDPLLGEFDRQEQRFQTLLKATQTDQIPPAAFVQKIDRMIIELNSLDQDLDKVPIPNEEIRGLTRNLKSACSFQRRSLDLLIELAKDEKNPKFKGPDGFKATQEAYGDAVDAFIAGRAAYLKTHQIITPNP